MQNYQKQGKSNKRKGSHFEREISKLLEKDLDGVEKANRAPMSGAAWVDGDIVIIKGDERLKKIVWECKYGKQIPKTIYNWVEKAKSEAEGKDYCIIMRRSFEEPLVVKPLKQEIKLLNELYHWEKENEVEI